MKILDRVARFFRPAPPPMLPLRPDPADPSTIADAIATALKAAGVAAPRVEIIDHRRHGKPPPFDGAIDAEEWSWKKWSGMMDEAKVPPGWAFCRFGNILGGRVGFVFGVTRNHFGIWEKPDVIFGVEDRAEKIVSCVTHLPSGMGCGMFMDRETAIEACNIAEDIVHRFPNARTENMATMLEFDAALRAAWTFNGIYSQGAHVHLPNGFAIPVQQRNPDALASGKPDKLS